jgi:hypothetical protein
VLAVAIRYGLREEAEAIASLVNRTAKEVGRMFERGSFLVLDRAGRGGLAGSVYIRMEGERAEVDLLSIAPDVAERNRLRQRLLEVADMLGRAHGCRVQVS